MSSVLFLITVFIAFGIYKLLAVLVRARHGTGRTVPSLPGPPNDNIWLGNTLQLLRAKNQVDLHRQWFREYGPTIIYSLGILRPTGRIYTTDLKAITHVLMNYYTYPKPKELGDITRQVVGDGVLLAEADDHRRQRKIMNPAFGPAQIRDLTAIFVEKAVRVKDIWASQAKINNGEARVDALSWLSKTALDIIGEAGFGYSVGALSEDPNHRNELSDTFAAVFKVGARLTLGTLITILRPRVPILRFLPGDRDLERKKAKEMMFGIGRKLLNERKHDSEKLRSTRSHDLLSLLHHANTAEDVPEKQKMSDEEVIAQVPTFILAGHETTGTATTWALYALTKHKDIQTNLREELATVPTDNPSMDDLNALPYLDAIVRETLRLYPPLPTTSRFAKEDDVIPLDKPIVDSQGRVHDKICVTKGQNIAIPIAIINTMPEIWGTDALEFNPSRWSSIPKSAAGIPGVWGNTLTFFGGPRACIGFRFAILEMKVLLFTLIRAFDIDLAVPHDDILQKSEMVTRPVLITDPDNTNQLPLIIRPLEL